MFGVRQEGYSHFSNSGPEGFLKVRAAGRAAFSVTVEIHKGWEGCLPERVTGEKLALRGIWESTVRWVQPASIQSINTVVE